MTNKETESKILKASADISNCISNTLLTLSAQLAKKYELTPPQLAVAIVNSQMQLLAAGAAGVILGAEATDAELQDKLASVMQSLQEVIGGLASVS